MYFWQWLAFWRHLRAPKAVWTFSGVTRGANNALGDGGVTHSDRPMTRTRAIEHVQKIAPLGAIIHVDDVNRIITYRTN